MTASALTTRTMANVLAAQISNGQAQLYMPLLEFVVNQVFLSLSTDIAISAADQAVLAAATTSDATDPSP